MRWEDERYVRVYTRDTNNWRRLGWEGQAALALLMRKVDRAGILEIGDDPPADGLALATGLPVEIARTAWSRMIESKTAVVREEAPRAICLPNFIEAQETPQSDAARKRTQREKARSGVTKRDHLRSRNVTNGHEVSRAVTPNLAVPSRTDLTTLSTSLTPVREVFDYWRQKMNKPRAKLDSKRERLIKARLAEGRTLDEMRRAIDGYATDPFSMGKNDRGKPFNDIALICRDAEHVERLLPAAPRAIAPPKKTDAEIAEEVRREFEAKHGHG